MIKKVLLVLGAGLAGLLIAKRVQEQRAEQELWAEATDDIRS